MSTVLDFAQNLNERALDVTKSGADALYKFAGKVVDAQAGVQAKVAENAPKLPEELQKLAEPVADFIGAPADYAKWAEHVGQEWETLRHKLNVKFVDLTDSLTPKVKAASKSA